MIGIFCTFLGILGGSCWILLRFFWRIFFEDFFGGIFWENFLGGILCSHCQSLLSYLNMEGIDLFVKILSEWRSKEEEEEEGKEI